MIVVPPRSTAVSSETAATASTQRDRHLQCIAAHGRAAWQKACGYTKRARAEAGISSFKPVIGDGLRSRTDERRANEVDVAVHVLDRMLRAVAHLAAGQVKGDRQAVEIGLEGRWCTWPVQG